MARRIVLTMLALVSVLLVTTMVPLGFITTGHECGFFRADTVFSAGTLASYAEEKIADREQASALTTTLARARRLGEQIRVYDATGHLVAGNGGQGMTVPAATLALVLGAGNAAVTETAEIGDRLDRKSTSLKSRQRWISY